MSEESRSSKRIPYSAMAELEKEDEVIICKLKDISSTGFRIDYIESFKEEDEIETTLFYNDEKLHVKAQVVWKDLHAGIGFKFVKVVGDIEQSGI